MDKKIKPINEFQDDVRFNFNLDERIITEGENKEICDYVNKMTEENLKNHPKRAAIEFMTIEEFRKTMNDAVVMDGEDFTEEDINELNEECMKYFGEQFIKKNDE